MKVYCLACQKRCKGEVLRVQEKYMHRDCFKCAACSVGLEKGGFFVRDAKFYCPDDYQNLFGVRCRICTDYVTGEVITALGSTFHPRCFQCQSCQTPFAPGDRVTLWSNQLYLCKTCTQREKLKDSNGLDGWSRPPGHAASVANGNGHAATDSDSAAAASSTPLPRHAMAYPQHLSLQHQHSPTSFSCPSESGVGGGGANSSIGVGTGGYAIPHRRFPISFGSHLLARSYLSMEQEADQRTHPNDRYRRTTSPSVCGSIAGSVVGVSGISPRHFHLPPGRASRQASLASRSTHPGSVTAGGSTRGGGGSGRRTPRSLSPSPGDDPLLLSLYPGGSKPDISRPAPIERDNWPAPAFSSLLLAELGRRHRGADGDSLTDDGILADRPECGRNGFDSEERRPQPRRSKLEQELAEGKIEIGGLGAALLLSNGSGRDDSDADSIHNQRRGSRVRVPLSFGPPPQPPGADSDFDADNDGSFNGQQQHSKSASLPLGTGRSHRRPASRQEDLLAAYPDILGLRPSPLNPGPAPPRLYAYEILRARPPPKDADPCRLEDHLADDDFGKVFKGLTRRQFHLLPEWKRNDMKRKAGLF